MGFIEEKERKNFLEWAMCNGWCNLWY